MEQYGESEEIISNVESEEGSNSPKDRPRKLSDLSSVVTEIMSLRADPESMKTELERVLGGFIGRRELTLEKERDPCTKQWDSANGLYPSVTRRLRLQFMDELSPSVLTGKEIKGKEGNSVRVAVVDSLTGQVVDSGPVASAKVEIMVLEKGSNGRSNWTTEGREGNKALLGGDVYCPLTNGVGILDPIKFRHTKHWTKKHEYMLGARLLDDFPGIEVEEALSEPFVVEDQRGKLYQKAYPPSLSHQVWRLDGIGKDGAFHKRLRENKIDTVEDFLILLNTNPQSLSQILKVSTASKMWEVVVRHARTCLPGEGAYLFYPPISEQRIAVVFDVMGQLKGLIMEHQFVPSDDLATSQKADAQKLVVSAFQQWREVLPVDDVASLIAGYQQLHNSLPITNYTLPDHPNGCDFETSDIGLYGNTPLNTSLTGTISHGDTYNSGDFDFPTGNSDCMSSQHLCLQGPTVYSGVEEAGLVTLNTNYGPSSFFGNNEEENDLGKLYEWTHSPFQADIASGLEYSGASSHNIFPPLDLSRDFQNWNNSGLTYDQVMNLMGPVYPSLTYETKSMMGEGIFVDELWHDCGVGSSLPPGITVFDLLEEPDASSCSTHVAVVKVRKRNFNRKNAQRRWKVLFSIMRWFSVRRDVTGRTSMCEDQTALSRGYFLTHHRSKNTDMGSEARLHSSVNDIFLSRSAAVSMNKAQRRYSSKREKAQARWRMLFSVMRWFSVKRNAEIKIRVRDMLKNLSVSSPDVADHRYKHNVGLLGNPNDSMVFDTLSTLLTSFNHGDRVQSSDDSFSVQPQMSEMNSPVLLNSSALGLNKSNRRYLARRNKAQRRWRMLFSVVRWFSVRRNVNEKGRLLLMGCT